MLTRKKRWGKRFLAAHSFIKRKKEKEVLSEIGNSLIETEEREMGRLGTSEVRGVRYYVHNLLAGVDGNIVKGELEKSNRQQPRSRKRKRNILLLPAEGRGFLHKGVDEGELPHREDEPAKRNFHCQKKELRALTPYERTSSFLHKPPSGRWTGNGLNRSEGKLIEDKDK